MRRFGREAIRRFLLSFALCVAGAAQAQDFPSRPLRLVAPFAAGGPADAAARTLAAGLQEALRQPVVVENRAGGNSQLALTAVRAAEADGYTLLWGGSAPMSAQPQMDTALSGLEKAFDPRTDFRIIAFAGTFDTMFITGASGRTSVRELLAELRKPGSNVSYMTLAAGSTFDMAQQYLVYLSKGTATPVRYKGVAAAYPDIFAGRIGLAMDTITNGTVGLIKEGKLRGLAVLMKTRSPKLPDVPTIAEAGLPELMEVDWDSWYGLFARQGTPQAIVDRLNEATQKVLADPANAARFDASAFRVYPPTNARDAQARWNTNFEATRGMLGKLGFLPK